MTPSQPVSPEDARDAVNSGLERAFGTRQHERADVTVEAEIVEIAAVEAGQHGDAEHLEHVALVLGGGLHDRLIAVDGDEARAAILQLADGSAHRGRYVEELEVTKDFPVPFEHPFEQLEVAAAHHQLEADLVERHGVAEFGRK